VTIIMIHDDPSLRTMTESAVARPLGPCWNRDTQHFIQVCNLDHSNKGSILCKPSKNEQIPLFIPRGEAIAGYVQWSIS
jgi:hypothetical protein